MKINLSKKIFLIFIFSLFLCAPTFASTIARPMSNSGLVGYWSFEEGVGSSKAYDRSGFGNTGTLTGGPNATSSYSGLGQALTFNGASSQYVSIPSTFGLGTSNYTISGWAYRSGTTDHGAFIKIGDTSSGVGIGISGSGTFEGAGNELTVLYEFVRWIPTGQNFGTGWHHFALVVDGAGYPTVYYDGVKVYSDTGAGPGTPPGNQTQIGGYSSAGPTNRFYTGSLDEVRVYNRALSADEISRLYKIQKPKVAGGVNNAGLVGYWPLDEGAGTRAEDVSFNNNNGTLTGGPTWVNGKNGKAVSFDGSDDAVTLGSSSNFSFGTADFTLSAWLKTTANGTYVAFGRYAGSGNDYWLGINGSTAHFSVDGAAVDSGTVNDNLWHHVVGVRLAGVCYVYVDGVVRPVTVSCGGTADPTGNLSIGRFGDSGFNWLGSVDDARVYNRALSATEIYNLYKGSKASVVGKSKADRLSNGLVGYWTFDANKLAGASVYDSSVTGITGSITSNAPPTIGRVGQALSFNGSNQNVSIPDNNAFDLSSSYSISTWVYGNSYNVATNKWIGIVTKGNTGETASNNHNYILGYNNNDGFGTGNRWLFDLENSAGANCDLIGNAPAATSTWYHLVGIFDNPNDTMSLYVNGELQAQVSCTLTPNTNALPILIGDDAHSSSIPWNGKIDDVRIYNRALSQDEVKALYNIGK